MMSYHHNKLLLKQAFTVKLLSKHKLLLSNEALAHLFSGDDTHLTVKHNYAITCVHYLGRSTICWAMITRATCSKLERSERLLHIVRAIVGQQNIVQRENERDDYLGHKNGSSEMTDTIAQLRLFGRQKCE